MTQKQILDYLSIHKERFEKLYSVKYLLSRLNLLLNVSVV